MTEKDYSLLRPFDLEAAKAGVLLCDQSGSTLAGLLCCTPDSSGYFRVWIDRIGGIVSCLHGKSIRLAPLYWVEGKPVYPGDVLWQTTPAGDVLKRKAKQISADGSYLEFEETGSWAMDGSVSKLSWVEPPPKPVKRWINIYAMDYTENARSHDSWSSKDLADGRAMAHRIACIEIELPPLPAK